MTVSIAHVVSTLPTEFVPRVSIVCVPREIGGVVKEKLSSVSLKVSSSGAASIHGPSSTLNSTLVIVLMLMSLPIP